jgi:SulP family sulfate permease
MSLSLERTATGVLFGAVNAVMTIPVMISFASIIFRHESFAAYLPSLVKITLFSCAVHQAMFTYSSGLNFSVGQVQDAGLIFLSSMAGHIADNILATSPEHMSDGALPPALIPTVLVVLSVYTAAMGAVLVLIGRLRLASVIQYLPMPVVGGTLLPFAPSATDLVSHVATPILCFPLFSAYYQGTWRSSGSTAAKQGSP